MKTNRASGTRHRVALVSAGALLVLSLSSCAPPCVVQRIVDGDTLIVRIEGKNERVRLRRENAPEMDEPGGPEAKATLEKRFPVGSAVTLEIHARDVYGRIIGDVRPSVSK